MKDLVEREGSLTSFQTPELLADWPDFSCATISLDAAGFGSGIAGVVDNGPSFLKGHAFDKCPTRPTVGATTFNYDQDIASATQQYFWDGYKIFSGHGDFQYEIPRRYSSFTRHC